MVGELPPGQPVLPVVSGPDLFLVLSGSGTPYADTIVVTKGTTRTIVGEVYDQYGNRAERTTFDRGVSWSSSDVAVARVAAPSANPPRFADLTAVEVGVATITASYGGTATGTVVVRVVP